MKRKRYSDYLQVIPGVLLVLALVGIVFANGIATRHTIESQATEYLEQSSDRAAEELEKSFLRQEESMQTMAHMTAHIMDYEYIDTAKLVHLTENSSFDGIEYIHPGGGCYGMNEKGWDVKDKEYFKDAMQQHVGYAYDDAPEREEAGCIVFYAPIVSDKGDFYGVLVGYLRRDTIENMLDVSFWGHSAKQYLCNADGTIAATNAGGESVANILDVYKNCGCMTEAEQEEFADHLKKKDGNFQYTHDKKKELGSISDVADGKFLLVETFPPELLSELTMAAQVKMHRAVAAVWVVLLAYGFIMFLVSRKTKACLEKENDKVNELLKGAEGLANHDELTGLYNRRGMLELINSQDLEEKQRAVLVLDIDLFKQINDQFGHQEGDKLLIRVAELLKETFRTEDILVRMGGDEFAVILPNFKQEQADIIRKKVNSLNQKMQNPADQVPAASISVGAAFSRPGEKDELFIRADKALYKMKENGRCGCCIYEEVFE